MGSDSDPVRLEALLAEQQALRRVATLVARDTEPTVLFDQVCRELGGIMSVRSTDMIRYDDDGSATIVGAWAARGAPSFPVGERIPIDPATVTGMIHATGMPQRVDDYSAVPGELAQRLREAGMRSVVGAPITVAGQIWGGIMATSAEAHAFPPGAENGIAGFAELVTAALANADAREKLALSRARIVAAGDAARRRIERDLHDGAQQRLVSLALQVQMLQGSVPAGSELAGELDVVRSELAETLTELRELARGIHPSVLSDRGLTAALEALAGRASMPVTLDVDPAGDELPGPLQTTAYFLVAEALTNCAKHARCERAEVSVQVTEDDLFVQVRDNGVGGADLAGGSGLRGLTDRVTALDGELSVVSEPGAGTTLAARIPLCTCDGLAAQDELAVGAHAG